MSWQLCHAVSLEAGAAKESQHEKELHMHNYTAKNACSFVILNKKKERFLQSSQQAVYALLNGTMRHVSFSPQGLQPFNSVHLS